MLVSYMYFLMLLPTFDSFFFFFNDTATTEIYTLSLHDALPIYFELRTLMNVAIIVAAGRGSRMGGGRAKQFREISGIPIIIHTLRRFEQCATVAESVVVLPEGEQGEFLSLAERDGLRKRARAVAGGQTRAESVWRGLQALDADDVEIVAVHDGVRPFVTPEEIDRTVREAERGGAAI